MIYPFPSVHNCQLCMAPDVKTILTRCDMCNVSLCNHCYHALQSKFYSQRAAL